MSRVNHARLWQGVFCALVLLCLPALVSAQTTWVWRDAGQYGYWTWDGVDRFRYDYSATQWEDWTTFGTWQKLGAVGASPVTRGAGLDFEHFIGNGTWRDLLTGWQYLFDTNYNGCSLWRDSTDPFRFSYCYATGQWNDFSWYSSGYWTGLGTQGLSQVFIGDGGWYNLGNGWEYEYVTSPTMGCSLWRDNTGPLRFSYCYNTGQWNDFSFYTPGYWAGIGVGAMSSAFIGDTSWHDLGNGWAYSYTAASNMGCSLWRDNTAPLRFSYCYNTGQWNDFSWYTPGYWSGIGVGSMSSAFIGDGEWHNLGTGWSYRYRSSMNGYAVYWDNDGMQFSYGYLYGMWNDYSPATSTWYGLGAGGLSSAFIGDDNPHNLANGWWYRYSGSYGYWYTGDPGEGSPMRFYYFYGLGQWGHYGYHGVGYELSATGVSNSFLGDGEWHYIGVTTGNGFAWDYMYSGGVGIWSDHDIDTERFKYDYALGQWQDNRSGVWYYLGAANLDSSFIGNGGSHLLGDDFTYEYYGSGSNRSGTWDLSAIGDSNHIFTYHYTEGQWYYQLYEGGTSALWAQTTLATDTYAGGSGDPWRTMVGPDGYLYFIADNSLGEDLYRWDGSQVTNISNYGFDSLTYDAGTADGAYFSATDGSSCSVWFYGGSWVQISDTAFSLIYYTATMGTANYYMIMDATFQRKLYKADFSAVDPWEQVGTYSFTGQWMYHTELNGDLYYSAKPYGGSNMYVYKLEGDDGSFTQINHTYSFSDYFRYLGKNDTDLFFAAYVSGSINDWDVYRCDGSTFTMISGNSHFYDVPDGQNQVMNNNLHVVAKLGSSDMDLYRWWWTGSAWEWQRVTSQNFYGLYPSTMQDSAIYYSGRLPTDTGYDLWRYDESDFGRISNVGLSELQYAGKLGTDLYWTVVYLFGPGDYRKDLYRWNGSLFENVSDAALYGLAYGTTFDNALYFGGAPVGGTATLYRWNGTSFAILYDTGLASGTYVTDVGTPQTETDRLLWKLADESYNWYFGSWDVGDGTGGQWTLAQVSSRDTVPVLYNRDYYFSGVLTGGDGFELMRYWGDYEYLTARLVD